MKKVFVAFLTAIVLCSSIMTTPVKAGWDRKSVAHNGANGFLYCSTGVTGYPSGYAASIEDNNGRDRDFEIYLRYTLTSGLSDTDYNYDHNDYLYLENHGISVAYCTGTFYVDESPISYFVDGR